MKKDDSPDLIWFNGQIVPWQQATVHVWSEVATRGANVFEGIRCYEQSNGSHAFVCLDEHLDRMFDGLKILRIDPPFTQQELKEGMMNLLDELNYQGHIYVRPTVYVDKGRFGSSHGPTKVGAYIVAFPVERSEKVDQGINICVSSWTRTDDSNISPLIKAGAAYQAFRLPMIEALDAGFDDAVLLNSSGNVAETTGATIFIRRKNTIITPPLAAGILESITRKNCIELLRNDLFMMVVERDIPRTELYLADEIFVTGTLAELTPVLSVDRIKINNGEVGAITKKIQQHYLNICQGKSPDNQSWLTPQKAPITI